MGAVERLMAEKLQLEKTLKRQFADCMEDAQKEVACERAALAQEDAELKQENVRLVNQMHGLGQATAEADDARLVAERALQDAELKFTGKLETLEQQMKELKATAKAPSSIKAAALCASS